MPVEQVSVRVLVLFFGGGHARPCLCTSCEAWRVLDPAKAIAAHPQKWPISAWVPLKRAPTSD